VLAPAMHEAGRRWQANLFSVAEEHYFTAVTQRVVAKVYSDVFLRRGRAATVVVACVPGELHELGARMVSDLLDLEGFRSRYLGASMPPRAVVDFACMHRADVLALSVTFPPHLREARKAVQLLRGDPRCQSMKVLVGGRAFDVPGIWHAVGADAWAPDAAAACIEVRRLTA
jgi:methanogenic corrinoid protein MtbC1